MNAPLPLHIHQRIRADIEGHILAGRWPPGHAIPSEHDLMVTYGCSRMTVNKVLSSLAAQGVINRRRRAGSVVARPSVDKAVLTIRDFPLEAARAGKTYAFELLAHGIERLDEAAARRNGLAVGTPVRQVTTLHRFDGAPEALEERLINLDLAPGARDELFCDEPPGTWLLQRVPWSDAEHVIRAVNASPTLAKRLGLAAGTACLVIERRTWQGAVLVTEARLYYPGEQHRLVGRFTSTGTTGASSGPVS
ncbi:MAG TPA: UTRA domain-containing protein [Beijerinckiaceae bacterium]|nr:UTRA domain-containing protein [Beijerinckiaceae bacterium]